MKLQKNRIAIFVIAMISGTAMAAPQGGNFAVGTGTITATGNNTVVDISGVPINLAVINWDSMNVGAGESLTFNNSTGVRLTAVNIDNQGSQTQINGAINSSNTSIVVVNKNGVSLGSGAQINTPSFVAASGNLDIEKAAFGQVYVDLTDAETIASRDASLNVEYDSSHTSLTYFNVNTAGSAPVSLNNNAQVSGNGSVSGETAYKNTTITAGENVSYNLSGIIASANVSVFGGHGNSAGDIKFIGDNAHVDILNTDTLYGELSGLGSMYISNTSGGISFEDVSLLNKYSYLTIVAQNQSLNIEGKLSADSIEFNYSNFENPADLSVINNADITTNLLWAMNSTGRDIYFQNNGVVSGRTVVAGPLINHNKIIGDEVNAISIENSGTIESTGSVRSNNQLINMETGVIRFVNKIEAASVENAGLISLSGSGGAAVGNLENNGEWVSFGSISGEISGSGTTKTGADGFSGTGIRADNIKNSGTIDLGQPPVVEPPVVEPPVVEPPVVEPPVVEPPVVEPPVVEPPVVEPPVVEPPVVEPPVVEPPVVEPPVVEPPVVEPPVVEPPVVEPPFVEPPVTTPNRSGISFSNGFLGVEQKNGEIVLGVGGSSTPIQIDIEGADINSKHEPDSVEDIF